MSSKSVIVFMSIVIVALSIACVGLVVALVAQSKDNGVVTRSKNTGLDKAEPIHENGHPTQSYSDQDEEEEEKQSLDEDNGRKETPLKPWEREIRLPRSVIPYHYDLYLHPDLQSGLFAGKVDVLIGCEEARDYLLIHTKTLDVKSVKFFRGHDRKSHPEREVELMETFQYEKNEFLVLRPSKEVPPDNYTIAIEFGGNLTNGIVGFYKSVYRKGNGEVVPIATSKFQPTYARRAFPCFDEPSFKSTFTITMVRPTQNYIALSNMPVEVETENKPSNGLTEVKFEKSVPMVSYLVCFIVCDFSYKEKWTSVHKTQFRVYATSSQKHRVQYALDLGANVTDYFEDYFQVPYPLPKQDMIAIPDFVAGAMEHWGLITYRETALLFDERESSSANQQRVATVVSHELVHQWFGNLVTLSWWDDLWLNEGFASYIEYKGVSNYHKDWEIDAQFLTLDLQPVMDLDATINSHPIIQTVEHPDQITELFDKISYSKGASVLRMLENFMGAEEFRIGISRFLEKYKYGNAVTNDLWKELERVSSRDLNITRIMETWTRQMGYPIINIERVKENTYRVRQSRYLLDPEAQYDSSESPYRYKWEVPLTWITNNQDEGVHQKWLASKEGFMELTVPPGSKWVKFNVGQYGYYRVNYPLREWKQFSDLLLTDFESLSVMDRSSLINDAFSLAESGHLDYSIPLAMTEYLKSETSLVPWETAYDKLYSMTLLLKDTQVYPVLRKYILNLVNVHYVRLGWEDEGTHPQKLNRVNILSLACQNGHEGCREEAGRLFSRWILEKAIYIPPNIRSQVYKYGMSEKGDYESWKVVLNRYLTEANAQEKKKLLRGLAWISEPWILKQFLEMAKNETVVRSQDYFTALKYIADNPIGTSLVWDFLRGEWQYLVERFSLNHRYLGRMPKFLAATFTTKFKLREMKDFFAAYPDAGAGSRSRKQALETVENNIKWLEKHKSSIHQWLLKNV